MYPSSELSQEKIESKDIFKNLKNDYFLQIIFNNLLKKKSLYIIKFLYKIIHNYLIQNLKKIKDEYYYK